MPRSRRKPRFVADDADALWDPLDDLWPLPQRDAEER
jgi:hypothetical protein